MEVGTKIYYINEINEIDTYIVIKIQKISFTQMIHLCHETKRNIKFTRSLDSIISEKRFFFDIKLAKEFQKEQQQIDLEKRLVYHNDAESMQLMKNIVDYCKGQQELSTCKECVFNPGPHGICRINAAHFKRRLQA